jgi:hypothetical protein
VRRGRDGSGNENNGITGKEGLMGEGERDSDGTHGHTEFWAIPHAS